VLYPTYSFDKIIVSTSGHTKELTHNVYRIFVAVAVDNGIFESFVLSIALSFCYWVHTADLYHLS